MQNCITDRLERFCSQNMMSQLMIRWYLQVTSRQLRRLQQFLRYKLFQRRFKYMFMVNTWNALEKLSVRSKKPRRIDKSRLSQATSTIPEKIKEFYIKSKVKQNAIEHIAAKHAYLKEVEKAKDNFERNRYRLDAERLLSRRLEEVKLELPEAPVLYYTLKEGVIQELIEQAQGQRIVWEFILDGSVRNFTDLKKVLRKLG